MAETWKGYELDEVVSALQKSIRRGDEEGAMWWAMELIPRFETYLWTRLLVIVHEDIGIANPELLTQLSILKEQFLLFREQGRDGSARLVLANTILLMCRSPKSRIADEFQRVMAQRYVDGPNLDIPDYALDKHTKSGKRRGRGMDHFLTEGAKLNPADATDNPYHDQACELWLAGKTDAPIWTWKKNGKKSRKQPAEGQLGMFNESQLNGEE